MSIDMQNSRLRLLLWLVYILKTGLQILKVQKVHRLCAKFEKKNQKRMGWPLLKSFDKGNAVFYFHALFMPVVQLH